MINVLFIEMKDGLDGEKLPENLSPAEYIRLRRLGQLSEEYFGDNEHDGYNKDGSKREYTPWSKILYSYRLLLVPVILYLQDDILKKASAYELV